MGLNEYIIIKIDIKITKTSCKCLANITMLQIIFRYDIIVERNKISLGHSIPIWDKHL
jgi:hypothetical protein